MEQSPNSLSLTHNHLRAVSKKKRKARSRWHVTAFTAGLGTTTPCSITVDMEPWSIPHISRLFTRVLATTTKICTTGGSSLTHVLTFCAHRHATLLVRALRLIVLVKLTQAITALTAVHRGRALVPSIFRVARFGRISCYTLLSGCRLP